MQVRGGALGFFFLSSHACFFYRSRMSKSVAKDVHYNKTHRALPVVSEAEWREARVKLLQKEVELARAQDELP
jgi:hypothetical protein